MTGGIYLELLRLAAPETIVVVTVLGVLAADLLGMRELDVTLRNSIGALICCMGLTIAIAWVVIFPEQTSFMDGMLVLDPMVRTVKVALLVLSACTILVSVGIVFTRHSGEYFALILLATVGMMFLVSAADILMIFLSLELTSLCLYVLAAFSKTSRSSAEAGLKYFLFGGMSAAFTLYGLSLLYGISGSTSLSVIATAIHGPGLDPLVVLALVMTAVGLAFKVAAAPFHLWAPDVYQGAPAPSAALIASGSKVAGFLVLTRVVSAGFAGVEGTAGWQSFRPGWVPLLAIMSLISIVLGNLAALVQTSVRRLLAYSAIAHAGYVLIGVIAGTSGLPAVVYYASTYALSTLGAFGVISIVERSAGGDALADFAGLSRRAPLLSGCMLVFILSLAGIPPLAGFFGKFYVFAAALRSTAPVLQLLWLVVVAIGFSAVSLYYYLLILKQIYVAVPAQSPPSNSHIDLLPQVAVLAMALGVVLLGCWPQLLLGRF